MRPRRGAQALLFLSFLLRHALSLILSAPESCGGTHVVTHATAFFGPRPGAADVRDVELFAPRAQKAGVYVRKVAAAVSRTVKRTKEDRRKRRLTRILGAVRHVTKAVKRHLEKLATSETYARDAGLGIGGAAETGPLRSVQDKAEERVDGADGAGGMDESVRETSQGDGNGDAKQGREDDDVKVLSLAGDAAEHGKAPSVNRTSPPFSLFDACTKLSVPADLVAVQGRVAVVARGDCDFAQKIGFMQDAGAVGVIVVNLKDGGEHLANMKLNDTKKNPENITIPAVMISYSDWETILPCRNDTMVVFTAEGEATFDIDYGRDALNWAMMRGMALWILCQCGVNVVRYKRRVSEFRARADAIAALPVDTYSRPQIHREQASSAGEDASPREDGMTESVPAPGVAGPAPSSPILDHDPERVGLISSSDTESAGASSSAGPSSASTAVEDEGDPDEEQPVCAVCLDHFETGQQVRLLACGHLYHRSCIDPWLQSSSNSCPLCKREVPNLPPPPTQLHYGSMNV